MHNEDDPEWGRASAEAIRNIYRKAAEVRADLNSRIYKIPGDFACIPMLSVDEHVDGATGWRETFGDDYLEFVRFYAGHGWLNKHEAWDLGLLETDDNLEPRVPFRR